MPASTGVRERNRVENTEAIKGVARDHLARDGAAALSLRAVARDVGMVSSAIYRYFPSRDDLLTALLVDAFNAVGEAVEAAESAAPRDDLEARWLAIGGAIRDWARSNPQEYALAYGSPVPGYAAPVDTVVPAARVSLVFLALVADGVRRCEVDVEDHLRTTRALRQDFARLRAVVPGLPDDVVARGLLVWTQLFGHISYELFGHLHNVITDYDALFALEMRRSWSYLTQA